MKSYSSPVVLPVSVRVNVVCLIISSLCSFCCCCKVVVVQLPLLDLPHPAGHAGLPEPLVMWPQWRRYLRGSVLQLLPGATAAAVPWPDLHQSTGQVFSGENILHYPNKSSKECRSHHTFESVEMPLSVGLDLELLLCHVVVNCYSVNVIMFTVRSGQSW